MASRGPGPGHALKGRIGSQLRHWRDEPMSRVAVRGRLTRPYWRRRFHTFGRSILHRPDWVYGPHKIAIGNDVIILQSIWLAAEQRSWNTDGPAIEIGDRVGIRPYCTISASQSVVIEEDVVLAAFTSVIDSDHTWRNGVPSVLGNEPEVSPIRIGRGTWVGERTAILRGASIGRFCVIGSNSVVRGGIPDYSVAVGAPARVVGTTMTPEWSPWTAEAPFAD